MRRIDDADTVAVLQIIQRSMDTNTFDAYRGEICGVLNEALDFYEKTDFEIYSEQLYMPSIDARFAQELDERQHYRTLYYRLIARKTARQAIHTARIRTRIHHEVFRAIVEHFDE